MATKITEIEVNTEKPVATKGMDVSPKIMNRGIQYLKADHRGHGVEVTQQRLPHSGCLGQPRSMCYQLLISFLTLFL